MTVNNKSTLFSTHSLTPEQLDQVRALGLTYTDRGVTIVGTPVGTNEYIKEVLCEKAQGALRILKDVQDAAMVGAMNSPWMDPQGLYHLVRDCANQVLRHLLRTVDPSLTTAAFREVDRTTLELVAQIFNIAGPDLTPVVRARITLPRSMTGLGVREYVMEAPCAFIGCVARVIPAMPAEQVPYIAPYERACGLLRDDIPSDMVPTLDDLIPKVDGGSVALPERKHLATKLMELRCKKLWHDTKAQASGPELHFIQKAGLSHAGDFLSGSLRDHACRMFSQFEPAVRLYLGVPVTPNRCFIAPCDGAVVHPNGAHGSHCRALVVHRHDDVRDILYAFLRSLVRNHGLRATVFRERWLRDCGLPPKQNAEGARADLVVFDELRRFHMFLDVTIIHPNPGECHSDPTKELRLAHRSKMIKYRTNHDVLEGQVIPLAFESTGARLAETDAFLGSLIRSVAKDDAKLMGRLWNRINYQLAAAVAKGEGNILTAIKRLNRLPGLVSVSSTHAPATGLGTGGPQEGGDGSETFAMEADVASHQDDALAITIQGSDTAGISTTSLTASAMTG